MAEPTKLFGRSLRFGLWCCRQLVKEFELDNTNQLGEKISEDIHLNLPIALKVANNSKSNSENIDLEQAMDLIDEYGGIAGNEAKEFQYQLYESLGVSREELEKLEKSAEEPKNKTQTSKKK